MRIAVIDIGTNTVLMTIADLETGEIIRDEHSIARLGEGVDHTHRISDEAYARFGEIMTRYKRLVTELHVERVVAFATSAMRDAENRDEIIARTKSDFDLSIELLSGADEAHWSFRGALYGIEASEIRSTVCGIDIGGGSTEISFGVRGEFDHGVSLNIGAVRIKERFLHTIGNESVAIARAYIRQQLQSALANEQHPNLLIAVAGTPTSLAAMKHKLSAFDVRVVDGTMLQAKEVSSLVVEMLSIPASELTRRYPAVTPARADILPAGAMILEEAMIAMKVDTVRVSTKGLRYGILLRELPVSTLSRGSRTD